MKLNFPINIKTLVLVGLLLFYVVILFSQITMSKREGMTEQEMNETKPLTDNLLGLKKSMKILTTKEIAGLNSNKNAVADIHDLNINLITLMKDNGMGTDALSALLNAITYSADVINSSNSTTKVTNAVNDNVQLILDYLDKSKAK